jgi:anti-anti-sigma regulatory factor
MEKLKFSALTDDSGKITTINLSGSLVVDTAQQLKSEFISATNKLSDSLSIHIRDVVDMDISAVQLFVAFIRRMDQLKIRYQFDWQLNEEQKLLFSNVGVGSELFMPV